MATIAAIDPVTRIEGHLKVEVTVDTVAGTQQVVDARATGTLFRGFEQILVGRDPGDAQHITERVCGVCPVSHGLASVKAQDACFGARVPANARIMRNLVLGANYLQSHILHFYHLAAQDFVDGPDMAPWQPSWRADKRLGARSGAALVDHYVTALAMRRKAHEMGALFGGRLPHPPTYVAGGFTARPTAARIAAFRGYLGKLIPFIEDVYIADVELLGKVYDDYFAIGRGHLDATGDRKLLRRGRIVDASRRVRAVDVAAISEHVSHSWYADADDRLRPSSGRTDPQYPKDGAYSWLKAPRYGARPYEVGPLARMWVNGDYRRGVSVMDRHVARALEARKVARAMRAWVGNLVVGGRVYVKPTVPSSGSARGLTEAPRGALGHWLRLSGGRVSRYQIVTPTCWNASPRDAGGVRGPLEQALVGTPVANVDEPIEVLRVIHSFDPCLSCAVHVMRPAKRGVVFAVDHVHG